MKKLFSALFILLLFACSCRRTENNMPVDVLLKDEAWYIRSSSAAFAEEDLQRLNPENATIRIVSADDDKIAVSVSFRWAEASMEVDIAPIPVQKGSDRLSVPACETEGIVRFGKEEDIVCRLCVEGVFHAPEDGRISSSFSISGKVATEKIFLKIDELVADADQAGFYPSFLIVDRATDTVYIFENGMDEEITLTLLGKEAQQEKIVIPARSDIHFLEKTEEWPSLQTCEQLSIASESGLEQDFPAGKGLLSPASYQESRRIQHTILEGTLCCLPWTVFYCRIDQNLFLSAQ